MKESVHLVGLVTIVASVCLSTHPAAAAKYKAVEVKDGGTIAGTVRWEGEIPKQHQLKVSGSPDKPCHAEPISNEDLVVSPDGKVRWVVAYIKKIGQGKAFEVDPDNPITMDQRGCQFKPHIVVVPERQPMRILNSDGVLHNVHLHAKKNEPFNRSMPGKLKQLDLTFRRSERIRVACDVHQWMSGWIIVAKHPYYAVTGEDGAFRFKGVPAGNYIVEIWHEKLGKQQSVVTVSPNAEARVEFVLKQK